MIKDTELSRCRTRNITGKGSAMYDIICCACQMKKEKTERKIIMKNNMVSKVKCILIATLVSSCMLACGNNSEYTNDNKTNEKNTNSDYYETNTATSEEDGSEVKDIYSVLSQYTCKIADAELWEGDIQVGDMLFKVDGTMTMDEVIKRMENSELDLEYDFSSTDMVTEDKTFSVYLYNQKLFDIEAAKLNGDDFSALGESMVIGIDAGDNAWYPGNIGVWSNDTAKDIQQYILDRAMQECIDYNHDDDDMLLEYSFDSEKSAYTIYFPFESRDLAGNRRVSSLTMSFDNNMKIESVKQKKSWGFHVNDDDQETLDKKVERTILQAKSGGTAFKTLLSSDDFTEDIIELLNEDVQDLVGVKIYDGSKSFSQTFSELKLIEIIIVTEDYQDYHLNYRAGDITLVLEDSSENTWKYLTINYDPIVIEPDGNISLNRDDIRAFINNNIEYAEGYYSDDKGLLDLETMKHEIIKVNELNDQSTHTEYEYYEQYKDWIYSRIENENSDDLRKISEEDFKKIVIADMEKITGVKFSDVSMNRLTDDGWYVITALSESTFNFNGEDTNEITYVSNIVLGETVDNSGYSFYLNLN